jgi:hypothetical protein
MCVSHGFIARCSSRLTLGNFPAVLLIKSQVGMGVLSLPSAMHTLGAVPAVLIILILGLLASCEFKKTFCEIAEPS